jgi:large subunit ribosomal protein L3
MVNGLLGKKIGMTQVFDESGKVIPVTVIEAGPCFVLGMGNAKNKIKIGFDVVKDNRVCNPMRGLFKKAKSPNLRFIREISVQEGTDIKDGQELKVDIFNSGDFVDVTGVSIGKGFQGGVKRWHWKGGPRSHGSMSHRRIGSVGSSAWPSRVWRGQHLPGHMGARKTTRQNVRVVQVDVENNLLVLKGPVPGHKNSLLLIRRSKKKESAAVQKTGQSQQEQEQKKEAKKK